MTICPPCPATPLQTLSFAQHGGWGQVDHQTPGVRQLAPRTCALQEAARRENRQQWRQHGLPILIIVIIITDITEGTIIQSCITIVIVIILQRLGVSMASFARWFTSC